MLKSKDSLKLLEIALKNKMKTHSVNFDKLNFMEVWSIFVEHTGFKIAVCVPICA